MTIDLSTPRLIHIVGVGGSGMSAIASVLVAMGHSVGGSDQADSAGLERLRAEGVRVHVGHGAEHLTSAAGPPEVVAVSTAIPADNPEVAAAAALGIPVLRRAEILAAIAATRRTIAVSGTHGKTTTSAMLASVMRRAGLDPSCIVGGDVHGIGGGARWGTGEWFVVEADESDGTFVELGAEIAVVTNVEADHLDHYGDLAAIERAFDRFLADAPGPNVVCADDPGAARLGRARGARTYGTAVDADYRIVDPQIDRLGSRFTLVHQGAPLGEVTLPIPGLHNIRNATAALVAGMAAGASFEAGRDALADYAGVGRRFERRGFEAGITVVDDYAHNPGKVAAVLAGARAGRWGRVVAVFQPHRYSRTQDLWREFADSFVAADLVVVCGVYGAGEARRPGVTGKLIVDAVLDAHPRSRVAWLPDRVDVLRYLAVELRDGDLCLTLGAGDVTTLADELLPVLAARTGERA